MVSSLFDTYRVLLISRFVMVLEGRTLILFPEKSSVSCISILLGISRLEKSPPLDNLVSSLFDTYRVLLISRFVKVLEGRTLILFPEKSPVPREVCPVYLSC